VLNFSDWQTYGEQKRAEALKNIERSISAGSMPPGDYTALDHSARLTDVGFAARSICTLIRSIRATLVRCNPSRSESSK
jgi:hypothetical protein